MDCRSALEILEAARPGSRDLHEAELFEAQAHLGNCGACDETFSARQRLDRRIGSVMRDVPIPAGLLERLTSAVAAKANVATPTATERVGESGIATADLPGVQSEASARSGGAPFQRRSVRIAAGLAACLAVAAAVWMFSGKPAPTLTVNEIGNEVPTLDREIDTLQAFDESFAAALPVGWESGKLSFDVMNGFGTARDGGHQMALVRFSYPSREGAAMPGLLVIVPKDVVVNADQLQGDFSLGQLGYTEAGDYATVSWATEDLVYICLVPSNEEARERLEQVLSSVPA